MSIYFSNFRTLGHFSSWSWVPLPNIIGHPVLSFTISLMLQHVLHTAVGFSTGGPPVSSLSPGTCQECKLWSRKMVLLHEKLHGVASSVGSQPLQVILIQANFKRTTGMQHLPVFPLALLLDCGLFQKLWWHHFHCDVISIQCRDNFFYELQFQFSDCSLCNLYGEPRVISPSASVLES